MVRCNLIHSSMPDGWYPNHAVWFVDLVDDAVRVRLLAVEQMTQRPFGLSAFRSNRATTRKAFQSKDSLLQSVVPARCGSRFAGMDFLEKMAEVVGRANRQLNAVWHVSGGSRQTRPARRGSGLWLHRPGPAGCLRGRWYALPGRAVAGRPCILHDGLRFAVDREDISKPRLLSQIYEVEGCSWRDLEPANAMITPEGVVKPQLSALLPMISSKFAVFGSAKKPEEITCGRRAAVSRRPHQCGPQRTPRTKAWRRCCPWHRHRPCQPAAVPLRPCCPSPLPNAKASCR